MAYTANFDPEKYAGMEEILEKITQLSPGEKLTIPLKGGIDIGTLRWKLYNWLFHNNRKKDFKIITELRSLIVVRKGQTIYNTTISSSLPAALDKVFQEMIPLADPLPFLFQKLNAGEISGTEVGLLLEKYNRLMQ